LAGAVAGGGDGALTDGLGVAGRHAEAVTGERLAQRRPGGAELGRGGVDAADLLGQPKRPFGLGAVREEPAGLPAQLVTAADSQPSSSGFRLGPAALRRPVPAMLAQRLVDLPDDVSGGVHDALGVAVALPVDDPADLAHCLVSPVVVEAGERLTYGLTFPTSPWRP
jgi:hypothetical protein